MPLFDGCGFGGGKGEVAYFAAGAGDFAVVVAMQSGEECGFGFWGHGADAVEHDGGAAEGAAEVHVEHGAESVFELRCVGAFDGPVAGVVDSGSHFVGDEGVVFDEEFDGEAADVVQLFKDEAHVGFGLSLQLGIVVGRDRGTQDALAVDVVGERVEGDVTPRVAGGDEGDFEVEVHHAFEDAGGSAGVGPGG